MRTNDGQACLSSLHYCDPQRQLEATRTSPLLLSRQRGTALLRKPSHPSCLLMDWQILAQETLHSFKTNQDMPIGYLMGMRDQKPRAVKLANSCWWTTTTSTSKSSRLHKQTWAGLCGSHEWQNSCRCLYKRLREIRWHLDGHLHAGHGRPISHKAHPRV